MPEQTISFEEIEKVLPYVQVPVTHISAAMQMLGRLPTDSGAWPLLNDLNGMVAKQYSEASKIAAEREAAAKKAAIEEKTAPPADNVSKIGSRKKK